MLFTGAWPTAQSERIKKTEKHEILFIISMITNHCNVNVSEEKQFNQVRSADLPVCQWAHFPDGSNVVKKFSG